jgi:exopolysaccharide biosynthesis polyprenyl glycosylphosphotransferase
MVEGVVTTETAAIEGKSAARSAFEPKSPLQRLFHVLTSRPFRVLMLATLDMLALLAGLTLAVYLVEDGHRAGKVIYLAPVLLAVLLAIFAAHGLYGRTQSRRNVGALLRAVSWCAVLSVLGSVFYPQSGLSVKAVLLGVVFVTALDGVLRALYEQGMKVAYRQRLGLMPTLVIGGEEETAWICHTMEQRQGTHTCVGELNLNGRGLDMPVLRRVLDRTEARHVILVGSERLSEANFLDLLRSAWLRKVKVEVVPSANILVVDELVVSQDVGLPLLRVSYPSLNKTQWTLKRTLDVTGSLLGLMVLSPLLVIVTAFVKLTSSGPILFSQKRVGADEKVFSFYKFRSMYKDADRRQEELESLNEADGVVFKIRDDPRVTRVGRFLRRWSIDELPQLINVLKGEMSLVGPRPLPVRDFLKMEESHKRRLGAVPGMTGYWQISGRSELSFEEMVRLDLYYIENWSLSFDLKIILKTLGAVLRHEGAY